MSGLLRAVRGKMGFILRLSVPYVVARASEKRGGRILDVGCGKGGIMVSIKKKGPFLTTGVDIFQPYLEECRERGTYHNLVRSDVRRLPFQNKSFDTVLCLEVLEHLEKEEGKRFLEQLEGIGRKRVIVSTPAGACKQQPFDDDPYQEHKSTWTAGEMESLGYKVRGFGFHGMYGDKGLRSRVPLLAVPFLHAAWVLSTPVTFFFPSLAGDMVCTKKLDL